MSGPTLAADFADLAGDPAPAHVAREPGAARPGPRAGARFGRPLRAEARSVEIGQVRMIHGAAAMLAASVLADSGVEHSRGQYHNPAMVLPLVSSTLSILASLDGGLRSEKAAHPLRLASYGIAMAVGALGTGFHVYNITKKPGGFSWQNLFYQAPIGAPAALSLSGLLGLAAEGIRDEAPGESPSLLGLPAGPALAGLTALGLLGTTAEVTLLHFRGNFQNPLMYLPVALPPIAAALTAEAALRPHRRPRPRAKLWLGITAALGVAGVAAHAYGTSRYMGGWKNWRQNLVDGPPIPAPPAFSGLALAGLAALALLERHGDD